MRSSVSVILSTPPPNTSMSHPDYDQTPYDHASILVLVKDIGCKSSTDLFKNIYSKITKINHINIVNTSGVSRDITTRYLQEYPVENNDWGDFQTHRRLLGLITIGKFETQVELNELCRVHESLKVKYTSTLYNSRCVLFGPSNNRSPITETPPALFTTPSNFKTRALFYSDLESTDLESQITDFLSSLFWVLESKRLERSREKIDKVSLLLAPFERKDFVGLDLDTRSNRKRCNGRMTKHLGDLSLQAGLVMEALDHYNNASEILKSINDWLWLGAAYEGMAAASVNVLLPLHIKESKQNLTFSQESTAQLNSVTHINPFSGVGSSNEISNVLTPEKILKKYREAIIHYSKYLNAGIIETEASFKAARIAIKTLNFLQAANFLQNVTLINLTLNEPEKIKRFVNLANLYIKIGFLRKASFCTRLAAMRHVSPQNVNPDWNQCYKLMLQTITGHKLTLDPNEFLKVDISGWPSLQIQLLQELIIAATRMGHPALAIRHMTFRLQTLWKYLTEEEKKEYTLQLQALADQCEGSPIPLVLDSGTVIPPANLIDIPQIRSFTLKKLIPSLQPEKIEIAKQESGPFLFTPIHFGSLERSKNVSSNKMEFLWVEGDTCQVEIQLMNPLNFELEIKDMRLLTNGPVFESVPSSLILPQDTNSHSVILTGTPKESGELEILGYSTHVLGVKSNCKLEYLSKIAFPSFVVEVIPLLPILQVSTSLPKVSNSSSKSNRDIDFITSDSISLYAGESNECTLTVMNKGEVPIELIDISFESSLDYSSQQEMFKLDKKQLESQLPIQPNRSINIIIHISSIANFINPTNLNWENATSSLVYSSHQTSNLSGPSSLPSRINSPSIYGKNLSQRRTDLTSSFRYSASTCSAGSSFSSSKYPLGKVARPLEAKTIESHMRIRYSGGPGFSQGYCRVCSLPITVELLPSIHITNWDVLPAETSSQFYLVLDVANTTNHELELQYTSTKNILIEANESCKIPVPVDRCPLDKITKMYKKEKLSTEDYFEIESICSEHIASNVDLRWRIISSENKGKVTLRGISLTSEMLDLVRMSPLQWDVVLNKQPIKLQEELSWKVGEYLQLGITIQNFLERPLWHVTLSVEFYQDHQNGINNYRLDNKLAITGSPIVFIPQLANQGSFFHECGIIFFTPGQYKVDIHCSSNENNNQILSEIGYSWKFIPSLTIIVVDV